MWRRNAGCGAEGGARATNLEEEWGAADLLVEPEAERGVADLLAELEAERGAPPSWLVVPPRGQVQGRALDAVLQRAHAAALVTSDGGRSSDWPATFGLRRESEANFGILWCGPKMGHPDGFPVGDRFCTQRHSI